MTRPELPELLARIRVRRLLSRYLAITDCHQLHVLLWLTTRPEVVTAQQCADAVQLSRERAEQLLNALRQANHIRVDYQWKPVAKRLVARLTARQLDLITDLTAHGDRFAPIDLDPRLLNTANSLVRLGYAERLTLYTLTPTTGEKLRGLT